MPTGATSPRRPHPAKPAVVGATVAALTLLFLTLVPTHTGCDPDEIREVIARSWTRILTDAARSFLAHHGRSPAAPAELVAADSSGRSEIENLEPDPWGTPYQLTMKSSPNRFVATSAGPNGQFGGADDISSVSIIR